MRGWLAGVVIGAAAALPALAALGAAPAAEAVKAPTSEQAAFFEAKVRPLLLDRCAKCHGEKLQQGGLRLDTPEGFRKGSDHGLVVDFANPDQSSLLKAVRHQGGLAMPPGEQLSPAEIEALARWVKDGAPWPDPKTAAAAKIVSQHWAFQAVRMPAIPRVKNHAWLKSPIDAFILAKLEAKGVKPSPQADRRTLIRRATFDLTGLPPTPEEIRDFLTDRSPNAWEKVVDRLLASPSYGERWGRHWLDLARYTDSRDVRDLGQPFDIVESYRYRDWVIKAFNEDLPYDQFITHQIAGDLLPPTEPGGVNADGITASSFLTIGVYGPGDADVKKMYTDMVDDQINAVSRAFLGLTIGCARCHDHKFDPISTADYYGLAGIFFSTQIAIPQISAPYNKVPLIPAAEIKRREAYAARVPELKKDLEAYLASAYAELPRQFLPQACLYLKAAWEVERAPGDRAAAVATVAAREHVDADFLKQWVEYLQPAPAQTGLMLNFSANSGTPGVHAWRGAASEPVLVVNTTDQTLHIPGTMPPRSVAAHPGPSNGVATSWVPPQPGVYRITGRIQDAHVGCGDGFEWEIQRLRSGAPQRLAGATHDEGGGSTLTDAPFAERLSQVRLDADDQLRFVVNPRANHGCDLTNMDIQIEEIGGGKRVWNLAKDLVAGPFKPGEGNPHADSYGRAGVWAFLDMAQVPTLLHASRAPGNPLEAWRKAGTPDEAEQAARVLCADLAATETDAAPTELGRLSRQLQSAVGPFRITNHNHDQLLSAEVSAEKRRREAEIESYGKAAPPPVPYAMGAVEGGVPGTQYAGFHDARIHIRGRYDRLGDVVPRRFPIVIAGDHQPPITQGSGRKELAAWIGSASNPLTGRVLVNRVWQHHFGEGIVRTPGNFGKLGEPPTDPALLDFLAATFTSRDAGGLNWSIKRLHRMLLLSSTYQQSSAQRPELNDPENRLWARMSVRRLEAESIRDTILAVSGKLDRKLGGEPLRKPGEDNTSLRRAVYLMTNRSDKTGFRFLYDGADPENVVDKRTVSTVAPQSLFLLNDPFMLEQTKALAERLLAPPGLTNDQRIANAYELLYGRPPTAAETSLGAAFLAKQSGTPAAWREYCQVLLCANELIYVD